MNANPDLIRFISESRKRKFSDSKVTEVLLSNGWPMEEIAKGFEHLSKRHNSKKSITIWVDKVVMDKLQKRAKKNMLSIQEQVEDIVRRSVLNQKSSHKQEKVDDMLVTLFSRKTKRR